MLQETARYVIRLQDTGILLEWDHTLTAGAIPVHFGSKEEGGLAVRVATPIAVSSNAGGQMRDSKGRNGGNAIWGQQADWVDYSSVIDDRHVGVTVIPHLDNFARCWYHARDYGLLGANPFGPLNTGKGRRLRPGDSLRLRFGVVVHGHESAEAYDLQQAVRTYTGQ